MRILPRSHKNPNALSEADLANIQTRVRSMRDQIVKRDVELCDLFALVGEDERPALQRIEAVKRPEQERLWPDQVPSATGATAAMPNIPYKEWHTAGTASLPTTP